MAVERLQKIVAKGGVSSRRAAEKLITSGRVRVNGKIVTELGAKADLDKDKVEVDGRRVVAEDLVYVILHKPRGYVSTLSDPEGRPTVKQLLARIPGRVYPVGRLDFATSGALLATNDGAFADGMLHPKKSVPKTYVLKVLGKMEEEDIEHWRKGIRLEDGVTLPAVVTLLRHEGDKTWLELTIREGRNQQIRRMGEATGFPVGRLARTSFAGVSTEGLRPGEFRHLTRDELVELRTQYGVPKSVRTHASDEPAGKRKGPNTHAPRDERERAENDFKKLKTSNRKAGQSSRRSTSKSAPQEEPRARGARSGGPSGRGARGEDRGYDRRGPTREESQGPRYGGGSPGRRPYDVKKDWGGGAGRGASGSDDRSGGDRNSMPPGRGGRSRTTGTGGGIGAREDVKDRVKGRNDRTSNERRPNDRRRGGR